MMVAAEIGLEAEETAEQDDRVLEGAMALLAGTLAALLEDDACRVERAHPIDEKPPEALARRIEPGAVVEPPDDREQLVQREIHQDSGGGAATGTGNRANTAAPVGVGDPSLRSFVTIAATTGRGIFNVAVTVTRPAASGTKVAALTGPPRVTNQT